MLRMSPLSHEKTQRPAYRTENICQIKSIIILRLGNQILPVNAYACIDSVKFTTKLTVLLYYLIELAREWHDYFAVRLRFTIQIQRLF